MGAARVDEIKATAAGGQKLLLVKSVCNNFTALPVVYRPLDNASWGPPYGAAHGGAPLFNSDVTCGRKGFEEPTLFVSPADGFLHFIGHDHGHCDAGGYEHFISRARSALGPWVRAAPFDGEMVEPLPVPRAGDGVFGGAILERWIDFRPRDPGNRSSSCLLFANVSYRWTRAASPSALFVL